MDIVKKTLASLVVIFLCACALLIGFELWVAFIAVCVKVARRQGLL